MKVFRKKRKWLIGIVIVILIGIGASYQPDESSEAVSGEQDLPETETDLAAKEPAYDAEELKIWLSATLYGSTEEVEVSKKQKKKWTEIPEEDFLLTWKGVVFDKIDKRSDNYNGIVEDIERAVTLYGQVWDSEDSVSVIAQYAAELSGLLQEKKELKQKYDFDLASAYQTYTTGEFYITQRLEQAYSDNILGKLEKEIDSYRESETSDWVAYNVEYYLGTAMPGDNFWIIHADSLNPFSQEGAYQVTYFDTGTTTNVSSSGGFRESVAVYRLIEDESQFTADASAYMQNLTLCESNCTKIKQELGMTAQPAESGSAAEDSNVQNLADGEPEALEEKADTAGNSAADAKAGVDWNALPGSYSRSVGPKCGISIWSADENGISFAMGIGASGYLAFVDIRECMAEWTGSNTAVYSNTYNGYRLEITVLEDGFLELTENQPFSEDFALAGNYVPDEIAEDHCEYVFPGNESYLLEAAELEGKTAAECRIARNEIYARYGRMFQDEQLQAYFDGCSWYEGTIAPDNFSDSVLNEVEKANLQAIADYETRMGYR